MNGQPIIRLMSSEDLPAVLEIEREVYVSLAPESEEALGSKLKIAPNTCWVSCRGQSLNGYLIALPWSYAAPPPVLHEPTLILPEPQDTLYIHDLALSLRAQGAGVGMALVIQALEYARGLGLKYSSLIAVQNSSQYWSRFGFRAVVDVSSELAEKLSSYGSAAVYMRMELAES